VPNILDALALASMEKPAQLQRIAALWCRGHTNREPYNHSEVRKWIKREFGPLLDDDKADRFAKKIEAEIKCQLRLRKRRAQRVTDPLTTPTGSQLRLERLLHNRLGPARSWASAWRMPTGGEAYYIDGDVYSGLVAGLIPVMMRLRSISDPNLLVYRHRRGPTCTVFVANHITTVADAFIWLIPPAAAEFLQLPGTRVEHNGLEQTVSLYTQFGDKVLPWRALTSP